MNRFKAPWGKSLWVMSAIGTAICLAISFFFTIFPTPPVRSLEFGIFSHLNGYLGLALFD
jgi:hypothetical protein